MEPWRASVAGMEPWRGQSCRRHHRGKGGEIPVSPSLTPSNLPSAPPTVCTQHKSQEHAASHRQPGCSQHREARGKGRSEGRECQTHTVATFHCQGKPQRSQIVATYLSLAPNLTLSLMNLKYYYILLLYNLYYLSTDVEYGGEDKGLD